MKVDKQIIKRHCVHWSNGEGLSRKANKQKPELKQPLLGTPRLEEEKAVPKWAILNNALSHSLALILKY